MTRNKLSLIIVALTTLGLTVALSACGDVKDAVEQEIDGEAAELKEPDMPNCSRVVNCCAKLKTYSLTPEDVNMACDTTFTPSADTLIDSYQTARDGIDPGLDNADELRDELKTLYQDRVEPGCRCFLDETVGDISQDGFLSPTDCEFDTTVGGLEPPATCEEAQTQLVENASNPPQLPEN